MEAAESFEFNSAEQSISDAISGQGFVPEKKVKPLVDRAVFVSIRLGKPGVSKKIDSYRVSFDSEESDALGESRNKVDRDMITVSKKLINCKEYKKITKIDGTLKKFIRNRCSPSLIRNGVFLLSVALVESVDRKVREFKAARESAIETYGLVYDARVAEALERLGPEGNRADYPPWEKVKAMFTFDVQYLSFAAPTVLGNVSEEIFAREQRKVEAQFKNALEVQLQGLREGMAQLVTAMADRLTVGPGGEKKVFHKSLIENMTDFLNVFDARNLADDRALAGIVDQAKMLLTGVDAKALRTDDEVRKDIAEGFSAIKAQLDSMVVETPGRAITFDD